MEKEDLTIFYNLCGEGRGHAPSSKHCETTTRATGNACAATRPRKPPSAAASPEVIC